MLNIGSTHWMMFCYLVAASMHLLLFVLLFLLSTNLINPTKRKQMNKKQQSITTNLKKIPT